MELAQLQELLDAALKDITNEDKGIQYQEAIAESLSGSTTVTEELISIIVCGMDVDQGSNFLDFLSGATIEDAQRAIRTAQKSKEIKKNRHDNAVKFFAAIFSLSLQEKHLFDIAGEALNSLSKAIRSDKKREPMAYSPVLVNYFVEQFPPKYSDYPDWSEIQAAPENKKLFIGILLETMEQDKDGYDFTQYHWLAKGSRYVEDELHKKAIEARIPESKIKDLQDILNWYKDIEKKLRDAVYEIDRLEQEIEKDKLIVHELTQTKGELEAEIDGLSRQIDHQRKQTEAAQLEAEERKELNAAFDALKKNDEAAILQDIANSLKMEYMDFQESEEEKMDSVLGEIYREKLRSIFRILAQKGVRMD